MSRYSSARMSGPPSMGWPMPLNTRPSMSPETRQLQGVAQKADLGLGQVDAGGGLKELDHGGVAVDLQHLGRGGWRRRCSSISASSS